MSSMLGFDVVCGSTIHGCPTRLRDETRPTTRRAVCVKPHDEAQNISRQREKKNGVGDTAQRKWKHEYVCF